MPKNRLALEKSPYLLQHAENPVDWYPWGNGAFEKARNENKPVYDEKADRRSWEAMKIFFAEIFR